MRKFEQTSFSPELIDTKRSSSFMSPQLVRDLMTVGVETCSRETPIEVLARSVLKNDGADIVVLDNGHALGVVGKTQLMEAYTRTDYPELTAGDIYREGVPQVPPDIPLVAAAQIMLDWGVTTLFLMHHAGGIAYPAAMISYRHILRHMISQEDKELSDLGIYAARQAPLDAFIQRRDAKKHKNQKMEE